MLRVEYEIKPAPDNLSDQKALLNLLGQDGWQLTHGSGHGFFVLIRPLAEPAEPAGPQFFDEEISDGPDYHRSDPG